MKVVINQQNENSTNEINLADDATLEDLLAQIEHITGMQRSDFRLIHRGKILSQAQPLLKLQEDMHVANGDTINLLQTIRASRQQTPSQPREDQQQSQQLNDLQRIFGNLGGQISDSISVVINGQPIQTPTQAGNSQQQPAQPAANPLSNIFNSLSSMFSNLPNQIQQAQRASQQQSQQQQPATQQPPAQPENPVTTTEISPPQIINDNEQPEEDISEQEQSEPQEQIHVDVITIDNNGTSQSYSNANPQATIQQMGQQFGQVMRQMMGVAQQQPPAAAQQTTSEPAQRQQPEAVQASQTKQKKSNQEGKAKQSQQAAAQKFCKKMASIASEYQTEILMKSASEPIDQATVVYNHYTKNITEEEEKIIKQMQSASKATEKQKLAQELKKCLKAKQSVQYYFMKFLNAENDKPELEALVDNMERQTAHHLSELSKEELIELIQSMKADLKK